MARNHARILTTIWADPTWKALTPEAQRVYVLALSQPNLSYCGVVPFTTRRWALLAKGSTPKDIAKAIEELVQERFVVVDMATEELWIRSFVKHDGVLKSPNMVRAMAKDFAAVMSEPIREAFLKGFAEGFREGFPEPIVKAFPEGFPEPFPKGFPKGFGEGFAEGFPVRAREAHARADAHRCAPAPHHPTPNPTPPPQHAANPSAGPSTEGEDEQAPEQLPDDPIVERLVELFPKSPWYRGQAMSVVQRARQHVDDQVIDEAIGRVAVVIEGGAGVRSMKYVWTTICNTAATRGVPISDSGPTWLNAGSSAKAAP